ncbi:MAG: restriction endonuclease [Verrucomicrobiia bacterium]
MGRRRRRRSDPVESLLELMGPLLALGLLLAFFAPQILRAIFGLVIMALFVVGCGVAAVILFLIVRGIIRRRREAHTPVQAHPVSGSVQPARPFVYPNPFENVPRSQWRVEEAKPSVEPKPVEDFPRPQRPVKMWGRLPPPVRTTPARPPREPDVQDKLRTIDWYQFEKVVTAIYEVPGCTVRRLGGAKSDGGVDLIAEQDGRRIVVQCKHWRKWSVGVRHIRELVGAKEIAHADKAVLVTLRGCTQDAKDLANQQGIDIIDETGLIKLMQMSDGSIDSKILALLNDTRKFCPRCESELVVRTAERGFNRGEQFWGCSNYPRCRYILRNA